MIPTGIAMAARLAPPGKSGVFMGIWNLMQGFSALLTGYIAFFTVITPTQNQLQINTQYSHVFFYTGIIIFFVGICALLLRKTINNSISNPTL